MRHVQQPMGFTLVELLVVVSLLGVLVGLLLPAVQMARETARRAQCGSNLHNLGIALHNFVDAKRVLPPGSDGYKQTEHAWSTYILPYLEQSNLHAQLNLAARWDSPNHTSLVNQTIPIYRCPSGVLEFAGKIDYGGVQGTGLTGLTIGDGAHEAFGCGSMIVTSRAQPRALSLASVIDGCSTTIALGESVDRHWESSGRWACGRNCFAQIGHRVNHGELGDLKSRHPQGAHAVFLDGHLRLLSESIDSYVLGAICTRNGAELEATWALD